MDCIFCKIIRGEIPSAKIFENESVYAFLDIGPVSQGHCLLVPKEHAAVLDTCRPELLAELGRCLGVVAKAVVRGVGAPGYNILCNNARCAGQLVDHVHFHIIPRWPEDGVFNRWPAKTYSSGEMEKVAQAITACFD